MGDGICPAENPQNLDQFFEIGLIFSSPEHGVLMVSYCDQSMSVVRRPCVVNFLL